MRIEFSDCARADSRQIGVASPELLRLWLPSQHVSEQLQLDVNGLRHREQVADAHKAVAVAPGLLYKAKRPTPYGMFRKWSRAVC